MLVLLFILIVSCTQTQEKAEKKIIETTNLIKGIEKYSIRSIEGKDYYQSERIARLVRGLLIFLSNHTKLIKSLPIGVLLRFVFFKYLKLLMPFFLALLLFGVVTFLISNHNLYLYMGVLIAAIAPLLNAKSRKFLSLFIKINYYFMTSTLSYLFGIKRSNNWEKLHVKSRK